MCAQSGKDDSKDEQHFAKARYDAEKARALMPACPKTHEWGLLPKNSNLGGVRITVLHAFHRY
ncbi:hypothetical protein B9Q13_00250 [Candidatus Marsarchaeota G2 archaeon ECH_B_SAG-G16]|uniref:Uncharacterized protein n=1 Tax=Candidatus Marsarchaeota G2 archaeon ECH_B_SAG-G16 TaxID=1978167 RepID=A0A2R6C4U4_9ARCH|nr:MAG: hypothetical protein B9Q13_00250 [Candidatus Marsarchaeota G2 archaeon ECH_B_SAG-G16]